SPSYTTYFTSLLLLDIVAVTSGLYYSAYNISLETASGILKGCLEIENFVDYLPYLYIYPRRIASLKTTLDDAGCSLWRNLSKVNDRRFYAMLIRLK
ncbi:hypothetical protein L9F63_002974, partial [Diploptera punctata]